MKARFAPFCHLREGSFFTLRIRHRGTLCSALEAAGVIFVDENGEGLGVRLREAGDR